MAHQRMRVTTVSMASKVPYQGQGNSAPESAVSPNPLNKVVNPTFNSNGKPIVKEQARSQSLNLSRSISGYSDLNQPFSTIPTLNQTFPAGTSTGGHYRIIDDAFSPASEHNTAFVTDRHDRDRIRQGAYLREVHERQ